MKGSKLIVLLILLSLVVAAGCAPTPTPPPATATLVSTATPLPASATPAPTASPPLAEGEVLIKLPSSNDVILGTVYGHGETTVILANMGYGGQFQWKAFAQFIAQKGFRAITFDYTQSDDYGIAALNTRAVLLFLQAKGVKHIVCMGASLGVSACASIAHEPELAGLVFIAGPNYSQSLYDVTCPKLFIAAENDKWAKATRGVYEDAAQPKAIEIIPKSSSHGTDLFLTEHGDTLRDLLVNFLESLPTKSPTD